MSSDLWDVGILISGCSVDCANSLELISVASQWILVSGPVVDGIAVSEEEIALEKVELSSLERLWRGSLQLKVFYRGPERHYLINRDNCWMASFSTQSPAALTRMRSDQIKGVFMERVPQKLEKSRNEMYANAQVDLIEINEAFATVVLVSARSILGMTKEDMFKRINVNGSAIA
jgi:uncharacterized lipoprotein YmbA